MRSPLPQFTTMLLLIHMGFGCCFHHAHACDSEGHFPKCEQAGSRGHAHAFGCEQHIHLPAVTVVANDASRLPLGSGHEDHHSHECSGEDCDFIAVLPRIVSGGEKTSHSLSLAVKNLCHSSLTLRDTALARNSAAAERSRSALRRTHLTLQILLL